MMSRDNMSKGLLKLMVRLPALRSDLQRLHSHDRTLRDLCDAYDATVFLKDGDDLRISAHRGPIPIDLEKWPINRNWVVGRSVVDRLPVHVSDFLSAEGANFPEGQEMSRRQGHRCVLSVPLLSEGESVGALQFAAWKQTRSPTIRLPCCRPSPIRP